ncbi:hypothetical protein [Trueperella bialowiezensis]|uniref:Uncharacterized protein n=1 Tax=Trueperella bialowiezensis TaxID=312285 RepID=A0A3S5EW20_9ACTO|nr:hypothetical protein [Trueperella bialowiezensis]VEI13234.1 Uncharacterised protein [Trueperella bialowiezensis]
MTDLTEYGSALNIRTTSVLIRTFPQDSVDKSVRIVRISTDKKLDPYCHFSALTSHSIKQKYGCTDTFQYICDEYPEELSQMSKNKNRKTLYTQRDSKTSVLPYCAASGQVAHA